MQTVKIVTENKRAYLKLLLEADPDEAMIDRYLDRGTLYVLEEDTVPVAVAVTVALDEARCELKNIAVDPAAQRRGYGAQLISHVFRTEANRFAEMLVGTTAPTMPFYERVGFTYSHKIPNFFLDNYPQPIFEGDVQCVDMLYLKRALLF